MAARSVPSQRSAKRRWSLCTESLGWRSRRPAQASARAVRFASSIIAILRAGGAARSILISTASASVEVSLARVRILRTLPCKVPLGKGPERWRIVSRPRQTNRRCGRQSTIAPMFRARFLHVHLAVLGALAQLGGLFRPSRRSGKLKALF